MKIAYPTAATVPASFSTDEIVRAIKLTADEKKTITSVLDELKHLDALVEGARPSNPEHHRQKKDAANGVMMTNPTPATVAAYQAALGAYLDPQALFTPVHDSLNILADRAAAKLTPIAERIHAAALEAAGDQKRFGLAELDAIEDTAERGSSLVKFAATHAATVEALRSEAELIGSTRGALNWLAKYGFVENPYDS